MLAALFGILSAGLMFAFLSSRGGDGGLNKALTSGDGAENVVVATRDVAAGETITADMLTTRPIAAADLLQGRVTKGTDLVGKVATAPIYTGEQVTTPKVTTYEGQSTLAYKVPNGMRALSLTVPHEAWAAAGLVQPGDRVDIYAIVTMSTVDPLTGQEKVNVTSGIIAQNVEVLAVAQTLVKTIPNLDEKKKAGADGSSGGSAATTSTAVQSPAPGDKTETYEKAVSITLALSPEQAARVSIVDSLKDEVGQYRITPRQKGDAAPVTGNTTWTLDDVFDTKKK
jgi:Flp pilus assembly protein CpaB